jgi:deoxyribonuclease-4
MSKLNSLLGSHVSKGKSVLETVNSILKTSDLRTFQIFTKSPQSVSKLSPMGDSDLGVLKKLISKHKFNLYIHGQYILNINRSDLNYQVSSVTDDMKYLGGACKGVIIHTGKDTKNLGYNQAFKNSTSNILAILKNTPKNTFLILETSVKSDSDTCQFSTIPGLAKLYRALNRDPRIKFCIDTCHIYASGYDISSPIGFKKYISEFDKSIGISKIELLHLNDSKFGLGSGKDRHSILRQGKLFGGGDAGKKNLSYIVKFCIKHKIKMISETKSTLNENLKIVQYIF